MKFDELINPKKPANFGPRVGFGPRKQNLAVRYASRKNEGTAVVLGGYEGETGSWVVLHDKARDAQVTVRPTQVNTL